MTTERSLKDFEICNMSNLTFSIKNNDNESKINLVEVNAIYLDYFFSEEDNLYKFTDRKSIGDRV